MQIVLASGSPRRQSLLELLRPEFTCITPDVDESRNEGETPKNYVSRLAIMKASAVDAQGALVLGADTTVTINNNVLGKPEDYEDATHMLSLLSGQSHQVMTGVAARCGDAIESFVVTTTVTFVQLSKRDIASYLDTAEPWDKAGAYAIQGRGGVFVQQIQGSYSSVVGLPLAETKTLIDKFCGAQR
ncbi:Maf family nucleotide pyrophosphatase [Luminiphilus sp.]|nr:Maf family nucleotide pyrophosphatase [Luminiphilus sp.]MDA8826557.1 Maf family nucleotide pyrophosphatase [Luminiphilus sp.]MDA9580043.1 Maf family nucleotide pyrophosphatase [Luminiphilus sp.]MDB2616884.1 Maf family nucleotide pyrophosphatase [Luminiphilus sp.]